MVTKVIDSLIKEMQVLNGNMGRLALFLATPTNINVVGTAQWYLMGKQLSYMEAYAGVLNSRLVHLEAKKEASDAS